MEELKNQLCSFCKKKTLTLIEQEKEIPHFGKVYLFSMSCSSCKFHKADVEAAESKEPSKYTITIDNKKDMDIKVVKSSEATVKIPNLRLSIEPGPASIGYITNVEGIITRFEDVIKDQRDDDEEEDLKIKKAAKNLLKKLWKVKLGDMPVKLVIEDPSGNSVIISPKAQKESLKSKK